jgi:hypothetical protein
MASTIWPKEDFVQILYYTNACTLMGLDNKSRGI